MEQENRNLSVVSTAHADDEKTIHAEREYSDKKDVEGARPASLSGSESIRLDESNQDAEFAVQTWPPCQRDRQAVLAGRASI